MLINYLLSNLDRDGFLVNINSTDSLIVANHYVIVWPLILTVCDIVLITLAQSALL